MPGHGPTTRVESRRLDTSSQVENGLIDTTIPLLSPLLVPTHRSCSLLLSLTPARSP
jgi:hypothetical protein